MKITATFPTDRAAALMGTMAKHFGHKIPVTLDETQARIVFEFGEAVIAQAPGALHLSVEAGQPEQQQRLCAVIESHLMRFAHRENPAPLAWSGAD